MKEILPGIVKVGYAKQSVLHRHAGLKGLAGAPVMVLSDIIWLDLIGQAKCETETSHSNGGYFETTTLEFATSSNFHWRQRLVFVAINAAGQSIVIGSAEEARCVVQITERCGAAGSEAAGITVKVTSKGVTSAHRTDL